MMEKTIILPSVALWFAISVTAFATDEEGTLQGFYGVPIQNAMAAKQAIAGNEPWVVPAYKKLIQRANSALLSHPRSVMDKVKVAVSGDKHDFFSYGPYWWPDVAKPNGLPYIKRDGYVNPTSKMGTDSIAFASMCSTVETLAFGYYFTGKETYAAKAAELVRVWFLNPETAMYPRINYGQAVPGELDGRFEGIIELRNLTRVTDSLALIDPCLAWTKQDRISFRNWLEAYLEWLTHNKLAAEDTSTRNNHVSWRDVQIVQFSLVLGRPDEGREFLKKEWPHLLASQIEPEGGQTLELARTNSLGYSMFNLEALLRLATLGDYLGYDCWIYKTTDGRSLDTALGYLVPYIDPAVPWPKDDVQSPERWNLMPCLIQAYDKHKSSQLKALIARFYGSGPELWRLQWPLPEEIELKTPAIKTIPSSPAQGLGEKVPIGVSSQ